MGRWAEKIKADCFTTSLKGVTIDAFLGAKFAAKAKERERHRERERQKGRNKKRKKDKKEERSKRKNESEANEETPNYTNPYHDERPGCWRWSLTANNGLLHHFAIKSRVYMVRPSQLSLPRLPSGQRLATPPRKK